MLFRCHVVGIGLEFERCNTRDDALYGIVRVSAFVWTFRDLIYDLVF